MINVFDKVDTEMVQIHDKPSYKWINITGSVKAGKTEFCVSLASKLRTIYIDLEKGSKAYVGSFLEVGSLPDLRSNMAVISKNIATIKPDVIVLDPIDKLADMISKWYCNDMGIKDLSEMPFGKGWSDTRDIMFNIINHCFSLAPLLITVTHLKISASEVATNNITYLDMDLPGKSKRMVQDTADVHAIFKRQKDEEGSSYLGVTVDASSTTDLAFGGSRIKDFYQVTNAKELHELILKNFS